ncbi:MAG: TRAP transporter small permease [Alphaproteobacteria bacterium]
MQHVARWLQARAENFAVFLMAAMFAAFVVQVFMRYAVNHPVAWTLEACLTAWLWLVLWGGAFVVKDRDHVKFDLFYVAMRERGRRALALVSAVAILVAFVASLPGALDYITFYSIKSSVSLGIRLDIVFSVYAVFAVAIIVRYAARALALVRGGAATTLDGEPRT